ncbi:Tat-binding like 7 [Senna tora]|uniref:Tat-binding like 7 n=1 Tax=Senna tora TaxID=362788 RepID=A0A834WMW1_9FABA|nr:Tat-binding like 7 [Senna tora]
MRLSSASGSSLEQRRVDRSGSRLRKKHKRLDAICEREYNRNHSELNEDDVEAGALEADSELRRSSRVRRAPVVLDASPPPPKKRRRLGKNVMLSGVRDVKSPGRVNQSPRGVETPGSWSSRLRSRGKNVGFKVKRERESPSGKRKLFEDMDRSRDNGKVEVLEISKKEELEGGMPKIVKSKRPGRIKATKHAEANKHNESHGSLDESKSQEVELILNQDEESASISETKLSGENVVETVDGEAPPMIGTSEVNTSDDLQLEECNGNVELSPVEHVDKPFDQLECVKEGENGREAVELVGNLTRQVENEVSVDKELSIDEKTLHDENIVKMDKPQQAPNDTTGQPRIKEGRRCGLCGGGTDGKPPKRLVQDNGDSENEVYSGSSATEEPNYDIWDGFGDEPGWLGRLLGPINDRYGIAGIWVHQHCAVWSPEVYFAGLGCLKNVRAALCRGRALKCTRCGRRGATIGCRVDRCPKTYHLPCARANGCIFDHRKFLIACTDHRHLFQPHGTQYFSRIKKLKARKMKLEMRKLSNDALRKDIEAEEKWLENCGEDEEFLKRESKRLHRDLVRIAPVYIGGPDSDGEKSFQGWESVAGLKDVIRCMKEVVILPLLYPEFFDNLGLTPPRGVLLHGYPGTGKTLVVRALIGACARGDKRIAYFARKGADCLGKYVGDAERQLRLLFQVAEKCQPSIIFFDEIDGLAPSRTRQQDQTHSSVVSTLLALLDGLKSRGSVVVIGATNRPDAVDPALRRPGRFDREIYFPLPSIEDRASILSLHTQNWPKPITGSLLEWIAEKTPGFAGADLQALCTQAAINALKRNFPLQEVLSAAAEKDSCGKRLPLPSIAVEERDWLEALSCSPPPCSRREAGNAANDIVCAPLPIHLIPCLLRPLCTMLISLYLDERLWLPPLISKAVKRIKNVIISALDKKKISVDHWWLHVDDFLQDANIAADVEKKLTCSGILSTNNGFAGSHHHADDTDDNRVKFEPSIKHNIGTCSGLLSNMSFALTNKTGFRILIVGNPKSGQRHLASCFLYCFVGNVEIQKIDMATISQEGQGDVVHGIAQILSRKTAFLYSIPINRVLSAVTFIRKEEVAIGVACKLKCASLQSCVIFMPRIDLWAVETHFKVAINSDHCTNNQIPEIEVSCFTQSQVEKNNEINPKKKNSREMAKGGQASIRASHAWMSFVEQVESIGVSTSLMILATSEVPYPELPGKVRDFFKSHQSSDSQSTSLVQTVPRFSLQMDGNFDRDEIINLCTVELLRNVIEQLIQLIHQRSHIHVGAKKGYRTYNSAEGCKDRASQEKETRPANEDKGKIQLPESSTKVPPPPNSRSLKGKSTLLLAISTFGYQILRFPHFAELCWVTSKLKEGPFADVSGPWKGWPFNSCIIRPSNPQDKVAISCSSSNIKSKEKTGIVRGLMAVGLSAYKGAYTSVREVSNEVRKVLEILVREINTKVQAGKDRYQYLRVLSQVAYLEDMVNNWAYALLSLEQDSPELVAKPTAASVGSLDSHEIHQGEDEDCQVAVPTEGHEPEMLNRCPKGIAAETPGSLALNNRNDNVDNMDHDGRVPMSEGCSLNHSFSDTHIKSSAAMIQTVDLVANEENGTLPGLSESGRAGNHEMINGDFGSSKGSNGSALTQSVAPSENEEFRLSKDFNGFTYTHSVAPSDNEIRSTCKPETADTGIKLSNVNSGIDENPVEINVSSSKSGDPAESGVICFYQCCSGCLYSLYHLTRKFLVHEWELNRSHWTVEDVHDVVASLSVDLISAVRKFYSVEDFKDKTSRQEKHGKSLGGLNSRMCNPRNLDSVIVPAECLSHSTGQHETESKDTALNEVKLDLKFVFRDGVLVHMDPDTDKDVSLHCKFETLCLCSFKELIVMTKHPFD